jgi:hypothetical protein
LTGSLADNGRSARLAHEIRRQDVNSRGGLLGRPGPRIYERLVDGHDVHLVVGWIRHQHPAAGHAVDGGAGSASSSVRWACSCLADSVSMARTIRSHHFRPKMVGGAMTGPQNTAVRTRLGPLLNGFVNYELRVRVFGVEVTQDARCCRCRR